MNKIKREYCVTFWFKDVAEDDIEHTVYVMSTSEAQAVETARRKWNNSPGCSICGKSLRGVRATVKRS